MAITMKQKYPIALALVFVFFLFCRNIMINSVISMISVYLICEKRLQAKNILSAIGVSFIVGILDFVLQNIIVMNLLSSVTVIIAEDLLCFLLFNFILLLKQRKTNQLNYKAVIIFILVSVALRIFFCTYHNLLLIENKNNFLDFLMLLQDNYLGFLLNISYFTAVTGFLFNTKINDTE